MLLPPTIRPTCFLGLPYRCCQLLLATAEKDALSKDTFAPKLEEAQQWYRQFVSISSCEWSRPQVPAGWEFDPQNAKNARGKCKFSPRSLCVCMRRKFGADVAGVAGVATGPSALLCAELMPTCHIQLCNAMYVYIRPGQRCCPARVSLTAPAQCFVHVGILAAWPPG